MPYANPSVYGASLRKWYPRKYGGKDRKRRRTTGYGVNKKATFKNPVVVSYNQSSVPAPRAGLPTRQRVKMSYFDIRSTSYASIADYTLAIHLRANGLHNPDIIVAGHQPMMYDNFANLYERYTVLGVKYTINISPTSSTSPQLHCIVACNEATPTSTPVPVNDAIIAVENGMSQQKLTVFENGPMIVNGHIDLAKMNGLTQTELISKFETAFGSDPADIIHLYAYIRAFTGTAASFIISYSLEYEVLLHGNRFTPIS